MKVPVLLLLVSLCFSLAPARLRRPVVAAPGAWARPRGRGGAGRGARRWRWAKVEELQAGEIPHQRGLRHRDPGGAPDRAGRRRRQEPRRPLLRSERQLRR
ncbi:Globulin-2 [Zea mays]|uniref:Globulin-2 n=1 Tax=Zea mays TaxID=4577 RepID=A0A1D6L7F6_MAIZE|nr:Globulin-2 [Zea mays]